MDDKNCTPITGNLLVRKGEAVPSSWRRRQPARANRPRAAADNVVQRTISFARRLSQDRFTQGPEKTHKIMVVLASEHETLGQIAAKKGLTGTRSSAMHWWLFEWLIDEILHELAAASPRACSAAGDLPQRCGRAELWRAPSDGLKRRNASARRCRKPFSVDRMRPAARPFGSATLMKSGSDAGLARRNLEHELAS